MAGASAGRLVWDHLGWGVSEAAVGTRSRAHLAQGGPPHVALPLSQPWQPPGVHRRAHGRG